MHFLRQHAKLIALLAPLVTFFLLPSLINHETVQMPERISVIEGQGFLTLGRCTNADHAGDYRGCVGNSTWQTFLSASTNGESSSAFSAGFFGSGFVVLESSSVCWCCSGNRKRCWVSEPA